MPSEYHQKLERPSWICPELRQVTLRQQEPVVAGMFHSGPPVLTRRYWRLVIDHVSIRVGSTSRRLLRALELGFTVTAITTNISTNLIATWLCDKFKGRARVRIDRIEVNLVAALQSRIMTDTADHRTIRAKCERDWPDDFRMQSANPRIMNLRIQRCAPTPASDDERRRPRCASDCGANRHYNQYPLHARP